MLAKLVTRHLRAYRLHVAVIIVMQVCAQIAALSLPTINADIINKGVVTADTGYVTTHSPVSYTHLTLPTSDLV